MNSMLCYIRSERLKWKKTFIPKLVWIAPAAALLLCAVFMGGSYFQEGAYNWWYTIFLPGALTLTCALAMQKEAKLKYRGLLALPIELKDIWGGKIASCGGWLLATTLVFLVSNVAGGLLFGNTIPISNSIAGSLLIFVTFLWQIPLCLFLAAKWGFFPAILLNMAGNIMGGLYFDAGGVMDVFPYTITLRLMCPVLSILPNGLPVPADSPLLGREMILTDTLISLAWFVLLSILTALWFRRQEAR